MQGDVLQAQLTARLGAFTLDVAFEAGVGFTTLFGPSGSGKTSILRIIAGLTAFDAGQLRFNDTLWADSKQALPPERRAVGYVFQSCALFPHLSVEDNIAFGSRTAEVALHWMNRFRLTSLSSRKPSHLSGGEIQRVALARALARSPRVLLLDEPFSSLDATLREELLAEVRQLVAEEGLVGVLVTHDEHEAEYLGGRVLQLSQGRMSESAL